MDGENKKGDPFERIEKLDNVTITYDDGDRAIIEAIHITYKGLSIIGRILTREKTKLLP